MFLYLFEDLITINQGFNDSITYRQSNSAIIQADILNTIRNFGINSIL